MTDQPGHAPRAMRQTERRVALAGRILAWIAGALVLLIALLVAGDVIWRNLAGTTPFHAFELSAYLFAAALAFGFAHTLLIGGNIRLDVCYSLFPAPLRRGLDLLALAMMAALGGILAHFAWRLAFTSLERGVTSVTLLAVPLALPQAIWAVGLSLFALTALWLTVHHGAALVRRDVAAADRIGAINPPDAAVAPAGASGDEGPA